MRSDILNNFKSSTLKNQPEKKIGSQIFNTLIVLLCMYIRN